MLDKFGRPDWDEWFMTLCYVVSQRSIDPSTKHGTVVVDDDRTILAVGFNGPPRGCWDDTLPLTRPEKYGIMLHSEEAAIANAARSGVSLKGSTFYITGRPCEKCVRLMINVGAKRIWFGQVNSHCVNNDSQKYTALMMNGQNIDWKVIDPNVSALLTKTQEYYDAKRQ